MPPLAPPAVAGRAWDFPAGYNLQTKPRAKEQITFQDLRDLADGYDVLRLAVETRKDEIARLLWRIKARDEKAGGYEDPRVATVTRFLTKPDGFHNWNDWIRIVLEDLFVIDAPTLYMRRTRAGKLFELHPIDGATIRRVIDDWGHTPQPYHEGGKLVYPVAYQQILKGYPAVDYTTQDLIYRPRNNRVNRAYGMSPVEQIVTTVNIALRKQLYTLHYFTEGNVPDSLIGTPEDWSPGEIKEYQQYWDNYFVGDLAHRRRAKFVPGKLTYTQLKEPDLKNEFDEWLARVVCYAFSLSPQWAVKQMNRGSAETQKEIGEEEGLRPVKNWIKGLIDDLLANEFDAEDLEFDWVQDEDPDEERQAHILEGLVSKGILTLNEARQALGRSPLDNAAANAPMIVTQTGWMPIEFNTIEGKQAMMAEFGTPDGSASPPAPVDHSKEKAAEKEEQATLAKRAEEKSDARHDSILAAILSRPNQTTIHNHVAAANTPPINVSTPDVKPVINFTSPEINVTSPDVKPIINVHLPRKSGERTVVTKYGEDGRISEFEKHEIGGD